MGLTRRAFVIRAPRDGVVITESMEMPARGEVLVTSEWGAVSPGSEALVYRGELPDGLSLDDTISSLNDSAYPVRYGYTVAGRVSHCGPGVDRDEWLGRRVFSFHPHASRLVVAPDALIPIPDSVSTESAPLYANLETALTLNWDGAVVHGEAVLVLGLGIVGVLTALIAARNGAGLVVAYDPDVSRQRYAEAIMGAGNDGIVVAGSLEEVDQRVAEYPGRYRGRYTGFDVVFELSGRPEVLNTAIARTAFGGRIVAGSWYGRKRGDIDLGGRFHRGRIRIVSSQVSTIPPGLTGRFDHSRRTAIVWSLMESLPWQQLERMTTSLDALPGVLGRIADGERLPPWISIDYARGAEE